MSLNRPSEYRSKAQDLNDILLLKQQVTKKGCCCKDPKSRCLNNRQFLNAIQPKRHLNNLKMSKASNFCSGSHSKIAPLDDWTALDHSNTRLVQYTDHD